VSITSPRQDSVIELPVAARWRAAHLETAEPGQVSPGQVYFAVFVDRPPLGPGQSLLSLVERECAAAGHGCANRAYFEQRNVYVTGGSSLDISNVPLIATHRKGARLHTLTVVLMNHDNRRVGESQWQRSFRVTGL
jgi:hypothetical protein